MKLRKEINLEQRQICVYIYMYVYCLLKKYCHRLCSFCDGEMYAERRGENMSKSSRINRLHWQYLLCRSGKCFPVTLKDFSENTPWHSRFALFRPVDANRRSETGNIVSKYFTVDVIVEYVDNKKQQKKTKTKKQRKKEKHFQTWNDVSPNLEIIGIFSRSAFNAAPLAMESKFKSKRNDVRR